MSNLESDLRFVSPGGRVHAKVGAWDPATGYSETPGTGEVSVIAVHEDGTLDLQILVHSLDQHHHRHVETFTRVPHVSQVARLKLPHRHPDGTPIVAYGEEQTHEVTGPHWWIDPARKQHAAR